MNDHTTTFPEWQATVRQAQAEMSRRAAGEAAERDKIEAARQRNLGADLAKALAHFGIVVPTPEKNEVIVDDFIFSLSDEGYNVTGTSNYVRFSLQVAKPKPDHIEDEDWRGAYRWVNITRQAELDSDWTSIHADFAWTLDFVNREYERLLKDYDHHQRYLAQQANPPAPTVDQQLAAAIRAIVREELDGRE